MPEKIEYSIHTQTVIKKMSAAKIMALEIRIAELEKKMETLLTNTSTPMTGGKKVKTKRPVNAWSLFIKHVSSEMKVANPDVKLKLSDIAKEAKTRKESGQYDEAHWKEMASKLKDLS